VQQLSRRVEALSAELEQLAPSRADRDKPRIRRRAGKKR